MRRLLERSARSGLRRGLSAATVATPRMLCRRRRDAAAREQIEPRRGDAAMTRRLCGDRRRADLRDVGAARWRLPIRSSPCPRRRVRRSIRARRPRMGARREPAANLGRIPIAPGERTNGGLDHDRRPLALLRFDAKQREQINAAQHTNDVGQGQRRRGLGRPLAQRHQRLLLSILLDAERHALRVFVGEYGVLAELGVARRHATPTAIP